MRWSRQLGANVASIRSKPGAQLRDVGLQPRDVFEQPPAGEFEKIEAEGRVLEIELFDLAVSDLQELAIPDAFQGLRAGLVRGNEPELSEDCIGGDGNAALGETVASGDNDEQPVGRIAFAKKNLSGARSPGRGKWF